MRLMAFIGQFLSLTSLTPAAGTWFGFSVDGIGSFLSQSTVGSYMAVPPKEAGQVDFRLPAIVVGMDVHLYSALPRSLRLRI